MRMFKLLKLDIRKVETYLNASYKNFPFFQEYLMLKKEKDRGVINSHINDYYL